MNTYVHPEMKLHKWTPIMPRDFFNVALLCKCMGRLSLAILDFQTPEGLKIEMPEQHEPPEFAITTAGYFFVSNYPVTINSKPVFFATTINNTDHYPLVCFIENEEIRVFTESGEFTEEFAAIEL